MTARQPSLHIDSLSVLGFSLPDPFCSRPTSLLHASDNAGERSGGQDNEETSSVVKKANGPPADGKPVLLSGGNPQIAKADGDAPVQAYIAAMPGWKSDTGRRLDALIVRTVPCRRREHLGGFSDSWC